MNYAIKINAFLHKIPPFLYEMKEQISLYGGRDKLRAVLLQESHIVSEYEQL